MYFYCVAVRLNDLEGYTHPSLAWQVPTVLQEKTWLLRLKDVLDSHLDHDLRMRRNIVCEGVNPFDVLRSGSISSSFCY